MEPENSEQTTGGTGKVDILHASSKFAICGLPLRADTYRGCSFGCKYCFSNNRKIMEFDKHLRIGNIPKLEKQLERVLGNSAPRDCNFIDALIADGITWHCGGMSDPFQPCEERYHITNQLVELTKQYNVSVLFSTKTDSLRGCSPDPELHTFQLSVTSAEGNKELEQGVASVDSRVKFYQQLKAAGFRVGIRVQPFIPGISGADIVELFSDADHFTIEGLKLVPQNAEHKEQVLSLTGLNKEMFTQMGLLNLRPELRAEFYRPMVEALEYHAIPYSIADNDMHHLSTCKCCCGDSLVSKATTFNNTALCYEHGREYSLADVERELGGAYAQCKVNQLFTSNRQEGCKTIGEFYAKRFNRASSPFSPLFLADYEAL